MRIVRRRRQPAPGGLTGRGLVLGVMLVFVAVILASPLHRYLAAHRALGQAQQQSQRDAQQLASLQAELNRWKDPSYVIMQARERLQYAKPGETVYVVIRPGDQQRGDAKASAPSTTTVVGNTWSSRLWSSVRAAYASS